MTTDLAPQAINQSAKRCRSAVKVPNSRAGWGSRSGLTATQWLRLPTSMAAASGSMRGKVSGSSCGVKRLALPWVPFRGGVSCRNVQGATRPGCGHHLHKLLNGVKSPQAWVGPISRPKALGPLPPITHSQHRRNQAIFRVFHASELDGHNCQATLAKADDGTAAALRPGAFLSHPKKRRFHTGYFESQPPLEEEDKRQFG